MVQLIKKLRQSAYDLYFVFTVQEEIGMYGAQTASFRITPDWGIADCRDIEKTVALLYWFLKQKLQKCVV